MDGRSLGGSDSSGWPRGFVLSYCATGVMWVGLTVDAILSGATWWHEGLLLISGLSFLVGFCSVGRDRWERTGVAELGPAELAAEKDIGAG